MGRRLVGFLLLLLLMHVAPARAALLSASDARIYRAAFAAAKAGEWSLALHEGARARDRRLETVLQWIEMTHGAAAFADITSFIAAHPDWPSQTLLRERAEEALAGASDAAATAWFAAHPPTTMAGKLRKAELLADQGRTAAADALVRAVWIEGDFTKFEEKSLLQRYHGILRTADHGARLDRLLWDHRIEPARRMLRLVGPSVRALAEARIALADLDPGVEGRLARLTAAQLRDPGLVYERVRWRRRKGLYDDAIALLEAAPRPVSHQNAWAVEREILARYALAEGKPEVAYRIAERHGLKTGANFAELEFLAGWVALRYLHEPDTAYDHFVRLYHGVKLPISVARGAYWSARAADAMGNHQLAETWYGIAADQITTYYGQLAAARIDAPTVARIAEPHARPDEIAAFNARGLVRVTRDLAEIGADEYVRPFVRHLSLQAATPVEHELVAHLATEIDRPDLAIETAKEASYDGVTLLDEGYPITHVPSGAEVERPLVLAVSRQESAFDRKAVSSAGARGVMQLMPATASHEAKLLHLPYSTARLTHDARYNLTLGSEYLSGLLGDFAGSYVLAVAAYNAGPARVREWIADFGDPRKKGVDVVDWIEAIPVSETRNYVQRVLENLQVYRFRLGDRRLAFSLPSDLKR
ncbi:MAG TPA: lytic transglycosylase domain-containing protein [Stellaceae bacterium]|nr:lytic transglycosylase domain-containing protein [Stellaceae bacterium]